MSIFHKKGSGFFDELKRRNVFKVGVAYVIISWLLAQVADLMLENFGAPAWVMKSFLGFLIIGFPLAIFFAWAFEMTPDGIRKEKDVDRSQSIAGTTGRKLDRSIIVILFIALVYFGWDNFVGSGSIPPQISQETEQSTSGKLNLNPASHATQKSIAVLPFLNMSTDAENEFFSDGISEEILNVLASIPDLKVAARTSAFAYKGTNTKISEIAKELGVNHVLEGSVRKSGNQVRVTAQLIKADDGFHLWSETYDRELTNIFVIQDEIADSIASALKVSLALEKGATGNLTGTRSIAAYEHYLKGMSLWHERTEGSLRKAIEEFNLAIALDPGFDKAYAGLAMTWTIIEGYVTVDPAQSAENARAAANKALALNPDNTEALAALGSVAMFNLRYEEAAAYYERAIGTNPSFATAHQWYSRLLFDMGDSEAAVIRGRQAQSLDPRSGIIGVNLALTLESLGRRQEAIAIAQDVIGFAPDFTEGLRLMMHLAIYDGDCETAAEYGNRLARALKKTVNATPVYLDLCQSEDPARRDAAVQTMLAWPSGFSSADATTLSYPEDLVIMFINLGLLDAAVDIAEKYRDFYAHIVLVWPRAMRSANATRFNCDPRVQTLIAQTGIPPIEGRNICD